MIAGPTKDRGHDPLPRHPHDAGRRHGACVRSSSRDGPFEDPRQIEVAAEICQSVVPDNGAFSAWRQGKPYDFEASPRGPRSGSRHPCVEWAVIPDVIDGNEAQNDALLDDWPLPASVSVPVYHMHEDIARLVRLAERFPRVALGSSGEYATVGTDQWWARMADMMDAICDAEGRPLVKLHGLRMLDPACSASCRWHRRLDQRRAERRHRQRLEQSYAPDSRACAR